MVKIQYTFILILCVNVVFSQNTTMDWLIFPTYDNIHSIPHINILWVEQNGKKGLITQSGKLITPIIYDSFYTVDSFYCIGEIEGIHHMFDRNGNKINKKDYTYISRHLGKGLVAVQYQNKFGLIDTLGQEILPYEYEDFLKDFTVPFFNKNKEFIPAKKNGKWGFISTTGIISIPFIYDLVYPFEDDLAKVIEGNEFYFIDKQGIKICKVEGRTLSRFKKNRLGMQKNGKWGFIDKKGDFVILPKYDDYIEFDEDSGYAQVWKNGKVGFVDINGKEYTNFIYDKISSTGYPFYGVWKNGKVGVLNQNLDEVIPPIFDYIEGCIGSENFNHKIKKYGLIIAKKNNKWGCIDTVGNTILPFKFSSCYILPESFIITTEWDISTYEEKINYFDLKGQKIKDPAYTLSKYRAKWISKNNKWGVVDKITEKILIPIELDNFAYFSPELWFAKINGKWGLLRHPYADKMKKN